MNRIEGRLTRVRVSAPGSELTPIAFGVIAHSDYLEDTFISHGHSTLVAVCPTREAQEAAFRLLSAPEETKNMTNVERARQWIEDRDLGRATVESDVMSLAMQFDKVREEALREGAGAESDAEHRRQYPHGCASRGKCFICHPVVPTSPT